MQSSITWREFLRQTLTLALPIAFQQLMLALSSCADTLMLTNVGQNELSAVSLATQFQFIFSLCLAALTLGMSILVAQYWGAGNTNAVERVLAFIMLYAGGLSLVFFALTLLIPETLMSIMTNDATLIAIGSQYLRVSSVSYLFIGLSQMYLCLMKNVGAAVTGMTVSTIGVIVHVALNAVLIYGWFGLPALGIFGAAISTVISRAIELVWSVLVASRNGRPRLRLSMMLHPDVALQKDFWKYSLPVLGNELVWGCGFTMYTVIMGHLGTDAVAANSIANIVKDLLVCLSLGLGNAGGILVGNLLGRNAFDQAKVMGDRLCVLVAAVGVGTGLLIIAARPLALQWAGLTPQATRYLSVMLFICAYYAACGCMANLTIAGIFCRRRFPVRTCLRCERYVACRRTGRSVGGFRVEVAGIGGLCFAEYRRMHQDDSCFAALSKVSLGQQCDETDRFRRSIKRMKNRYRQSPCHTALHSATRALSLADLNHVIIYFMRLRSTY